MCRTIGCALLGLLPMILCSQSQAEEASVIFADSFQQRLANGWHWLRELPGAWRIRDGGLEIRALPGDANSVVNALRRSAPDRTAGPFAVEVTVSNLSPPTIQYEQVGITWYIEDKPVFKLVKERIDGEMFIIPGRKPVADVPIRLRLVIDGDRWIAEYRPAEEKEFLVAAEGTLPPTKNDQVSLQCYHGPRDSEHWMRFEDFRIVRLNQGP
ncbi:MAG: hypothetical protein ACUVQG_09810 [Thermogutta sp.]